MKKYIIASALLIVGIITNTLKTEFNSVDFKLLEAYAQNSDLHEAHGGDMTWDDVADMLNDWDNLLPWNDFEEGDRTYNNEYCDSFHNFCDVYDLTGDPVPGEMTLSDGTKAAITIDDCDGQPNAC